jgi:hypothetical protein
LLQHHTVAELKDGLLGLFAEKTISKGITKLLDLGFITQSRNPNPRYKFDQTYHYQVFPSVIQDAIDALSKDTESIPHNGIMQSAKKLYDSAITPNHTAKVPDESSFLANHYQDPFQNTNQDTSQNTHPERVREAAPVVKISEPEPEPDPEPSQDPRISPLPAEELASTNNLSGEGEFSGGVVSQSTQNFNNRWNYSSDIAHITDEIIRLYNIGKPDNWTGIPGDCRAARKAIENKIHRLVKDGGALSEIPKLMQNALLHCQSNDFYKKKEFGSGDIYWLCKDDRVEIAASKFQGSSESAKRKVATAILERENGIKHWRTGEIMAESTVRMYRRTIPKMRLDHVDRPPLEWIKQYMPDILDKLSHEYN